MVTIIDVAKAAGVSPSTVSHVLNGKRPISDATKKRVHDAIVALGYEPNPNAQALRSTSSGIIAFYASDITEVFSTLIIQGAERICRENNYYMIFASGVEFNNDIAEAMHFLKRRRIDGLIVSFGIRKRIENRLPKALDFPVVSINARVSDDIPSIQPDDYSGGREAARYLLQRGAKNPAIIGGPESRLASEERIQGFVDEMAAQSIPFDRDKMIVYGDFSFDSGRTCMATLLQRDRSIDAVFCANDYMAAGAITEAQKQNIAIPQQLRIVGYDNREFDWFWPIPITTFSLPLAEMGEKGASTLIRMIKGEKPEPFHVVIPSSLVTRASS
ncbi:MAG: LacI family DNA-binding transcriptional regulator [Spirochaetia bacterium]|jgi:DNA-binding LacI/PurR family transcriptional regulator|uniref:Transcriptional regulator, LacI family n=1 Tax=uncultured spirochete TaxID=156406 RepID=A0A3P3XJ95_9SPIR|nr:LacI family DNA-binding transcriptional regulator [Spirochaetia bacterium]SLM13519.1 Transcriptional regulator, LacI family [uncultured spirochete]